MVVSPPFALAGAVGAAVGAGLALYGWRRRTLHRAIVETPTRDVRQIDRPGVVELVGEVVPATAVEDGVDAAPFEAPLSGTDDAVVAGWEVEEWSETGDHSRWRSLAEGVDAVPFYLDDGTDRVLVDPGSHAERGGLLGRVRDLGELRDSVGGEGLLVDFRRLPTVREVGAESETPADVRRFVDRQPTVGRQTGSITNLIDIGNAHGDRRYAEATIRTGQEVYLLGPARRRGDAGPATARLRPEDAVVAPDPEGDVPFLLSERSEERLADETGVGRYALVAGLVLLAVGLATLVSGLGVA